jgi:hypothetical protein
VGNQKQPDQGHAPCLAHELREGADSIETAFDADILAGDEGGPRKT